MSAEALAECVNRINALRQKQLGGSPLTDEELKEGISLLRDARVLRGKGNGKTKEQTTADVSKPLEELF